MNFKPDLEIGQKVDNDTIIRIFRCARQGGIRRSLKTKTLVLISDYKSTLYPNARPNDDGVWKFSGMGTEGDQSIEYRQNKTLFESNITNIELHLFTKGSENNRNNEYEYIGRMLLIGEPENFYDEDSGRNILLFPLISAGSMKDMTEFLLELDKKRLINKKIIDGGNNYLSGENYNELISLMRDREVDTLVGSDGWFLNVQGYFYNQFSKSKWGKIDVILDKKELFLRQNKYINPYFKNSLVYSEKDNINKKIETDSVDGFFRLRSLKMQLRDRNYTVTISKDDKVIKSDGDKYYTTLLIGPNGTGKSLILSSIQKIFLDIYLLNISKGIKHTKELDFEISYIVNNKEFLIKKQKSKITFYQDSEIVGLKEILIPDRVISCAFTIQDRFTVNKNNDSLLEEYQYLGVKNQSFNELTNLLSSNIINASLSDRNFLFSLKNITDFLSFEPELKIVLKLKNNKISMDETYEESYLYQKLKERPETIKAKDITGFWERYNNVGNTESEKNLGVFSYSNDSLEVIFNFDNAAIYEELYEEFEILKKQIELGIFDKPIIRMKKNNSWISLEESSSGEFQFMSNMINILSKVKSRSLILIDEPETSLHPNWQFKYMSVLEKIFNKYVGCHFIMATHSHFMVSDLKNESSSLIELKKDIENNVVSRNINEFMYGRSAEDILYEVFNLPTSRNYYLANDLDEILKAVSLGKIDKHIEEKIFKLMDIKEYLKESDPLKQLIETLYLKVGINGNYA